MIRPTAFGLAAAMAVTFSAPMAFAEIYLREGNQQIEVTKTDGRLSCLRTSDSYEMCNGMTEQADGTWKGKKMKHPDMPRWMSFNGTVTFNDTGLKIKGCALGICDSENWTKQ
jgi:hypothetical protein